MQNCNLNTPHNDGRRPIAIVKNFTGSLKSHICKKVFGYSQSYQNITAFGLIILVYLIKKHLRECDTFKIPR